MRFTEPKAFRAGVIADVRGQAQARQEAGVVRVIQEAVGGGGLSGMVRLTPKETGRARESWQVIEGTQAATLPPAAQYAGDTESISSKLSSRAERLIGARRLRAVMTVLYSKFIENGSPSQGVAIAAPVRRTLDALRPRIEGLINDV